MLRSKSPSFSSAFQIHISTDKSLKDKNKLLAPHVSGYVEVLFQDSLEEVVVMSGDDGKSTSKMLPPFKSSVRRAKMMLLQPTRL